MLVIDTANIDRNREVVVIVARLSKPGHAEQHKRLLELLLGRGGICGGGAIRRRSACCCGSFGFCWSFGCCRSAFGHWHSFRLWSRSFRRCVGWLLWSRCLRRLVAIGRLRRRRLRIFWLHSIWLSTIRIGSIGLRYFRRRSDRFRLSGSRACRCRASWCRASGTGALRWIGGGRTGRRALRCVTGRGIDFVFLTQSGLDCFGEFLGLLNEDSAEPCEHDPDGGDHHGHSREQVTCPCSEGTLPPHTPEGTSQTAPASHAEGESR